MASKKWTTQEDEILKQVYDKMSYPEIVEKYFPERTVPSVRGRIKTLGLESKTFRWSDEDIALLTEKYENGMYVKDIQKNYFPQLTLSQVTSKASVLHLKHKVSCVWSIEEDEILKDKFEDLFISGFYMATDLDTILKREAKKENANEDFVFEVIKKTSVPHMNEGFDNLELIGFDRFKTREIYFDKQLSYQDYVKKVLSYPIINKTIELPHDNHDNVFSVSRHMFYAYQNISKLTDNKQLIAAAMLHDVGKGITKRTSDNVYADATFDGHVNVSAQLAVLYLLNCGISKEEIFKIVFYIQNHILIKEYENNPNKKNELEKLLGCEIQNLKLLEIVNQSVK